VKFRGPIITTETIIYRSLNGTVRRIRGEHRQMSKFNLD
jgi:fructose-1,6-bisphosphatase II / sedoheptulose-1,7-bisphosphatase